MVLNRREVSALFFPFLMRLQVSYDEGGPRPTEDIAWGHSFQQEIRAAVRGTRTWGVFVNPINGKWLEGATLLFSLVSLLTAALSVFTEHNIYVTVLFGLIALVLFVVSAWSGACSFDRIRERYTIHLLDTAQAEVLRRNPSHWTTVEAPYDGK